MKWVIAVMLVLAWPVMAQTKPDAEAEYSAAISKRADDVVVALKLEDQAKAAKVHDFVVQQYRALRDWHDANDAKMKGASEEEKAAVRATLKPIHDRFVAALGEQLTPEQLEIVKDRMTYNVVQVTYKAYCEMIPRLREEQKARILGLLKEAREIAMDEGSSKEKHAVFGKYKGKINNYLSREGYNIREEERAWAERRRASTQKD